MAKYQKQASSARRKQKVFEVVETKYERKPVLC